ncbi:VOC family protein [Trueperella sp. LYQ143]|uniref:VOC family protein n=1 Tax=unclassified Trueperella TaxID=2630174 RepID=UPI003983472D
MKVEHIAVYVADLERAREFFVRYFDGTSNNRYVNERTGFSSYFITFSDGPRLEIMHNDNRNSSASGQGLGYHHIAFSVGSREAVDEKTRQLTAAGYRLESAPRTTGDGYYESVILDAEGNHIEITV